MQEQEGLLPPTCQACCARRGHPVAAVRGARHSPVIINTEPQILLLQEGPLPPGMAGLVRSYAGEATLQRINDDYDAATSR